MRATSIEERLADFVIRVFDAMGICIWTCNDTKNIRNLIEKNHLQHAMRYLARPTWNQYPNLTGYNHYR
jgi:hypothetical protein